MAVNLTPLVSSSVLAVTPSTSGEPGPGSAGGRGGPHTVQMSQWVTWFSCCLPGTGDSAGKIKEQQRMVACSPSLVACSTMLNVIVCVL